MQQKVQPTLNHDQNDSAGTCRVSEQENLISVNMNSNTVFVVLKDYKDQQHSLGILSGDGGESFL